MIGSEKELKKLLVTFDCQVYSLIAVKKAAYKYMDSAFANISIGGNNICCLLNFPSSSSDESCSKLVEEFKKEVLDQDLREKIKVETEAVRNLILAYAFSQTGIINNEQVSEK